MIEVRKRGLPASRPSSTGLLTRGWPKRFTGVPRALGVAYDARSRMVDKVGAVRPEVAVNVLIIEDQHDIAANIWDYLERRGHQVDHAADGSAGLHRALYGDFDVIVLDLGLPRLDGLLLCRKLREAGRGVPVLMLTARDTLDDKLKGFGEGADDYMVKPFELRELEARLNALNRHCLSAPASELACGPLSYSVESMLATREGRRFNLTRAQGAILQLLMRRSPAVVTHQALCAEIWGPVNLNLPALHNHVYGLRHIVDRPFAVPMIQSVHGMGYRLLPPE